LAGCFVGRLFFTDKIAVLSFGVFHNRSLFVTFEIGLSKASPDSVGPLVAFVGNNKLRLCRVCAIIEMVADYQRRNVVLNNALLCIWPMLRGSSMNGACVAIIANPLGSVCLTSGLIEHWRQNLGRRQ
jgi:hypothetical protein